MRKVQIKLLNGEDKEVSISKLDVLRRNQIFNKYLNLKQLMKQKGDIQSDSIMDLIKEDESVFDFIADCLKSSLKGVDLTELEGNVADNLFSENSDYILGMNGDASKN